MLTTLDDTDIDLADWSEDRLSWLVDRIASTPSGKVVMRRKVASLPPESEGRVVDEQEIRDGLVLRLQYVPCGKAKCRKDPDEHGPYWYSYFLVNGRWKRQYHGRIRPPAEEFWTVAQAEQTVSQFSQGQDLGDSKLAMLESLANSMAAMSEDPRASALEKRTRRLITAERERRDDRTRRRYQELMSKRNAPHSLTSAEREELDRICGVFAQDH